ncbi:MAG: bifunctional [glutamate--ammonia ligase]-adenylyl-L-tyrosine phosphorylase/[glutamate--ammonia-ligase] adenylyltransferase [endosymbiont of Galathealinum brachiosum]|uniref:Bifunctional glutamine synthetase adenylyltransferase/adenylyl-removing enzyme n=1 Tax=endosymbiont of Galathealinum brachiosum TaxID=2200906 RepID=A0A370DAE1_9GAMM|nr:MAG: bifunctional [glutamate--ammonia ligase]-adenylyl-L-tyrosine phosphorylase/[glutamate--ammonia-ligase] adenylyltransferase [endosymbiont of Galathealinum brachiosum]
MTVNSEKSLLNLVPEILHERVTRHWQDWVKACESIEQNPQQETDLTLLGKIWACSEFIPLTMIRHPQLWFDLIQGNFLNLSFTLEDYRQHLMLRLEENSAINDIALMKQLRLFRAQQMLRIAWRDLADSANTKETLCNLTDLAESLVDITLETLYQDQCEQLGVPFNSREEQQRLVILGMGKLGGYELNFSSDIDLIFCFEEEGEISGKRSLANSQFFIRLGQRFIKALNDVTADGFVFRVDMRLRPYGDSGPLVMSQAGLEQYYQTQGRDWERYAMIKARVIGGDRIEGEAVMDMLKPFIYRRYLDFGAFESIRDMKAMINAEILRKGNLNNIKLGSGGIREIEFIGQTFQLLRGGSDPDLQIRGILDVLKVLAEKEYLDSKESDSLTASYDFLRRLENRLQIYADAQTHLLPDGKEQQASMALAMGYESWQSLFDDCEKHRASVQASFVLLLNEQGSESENDAEQEKTEENSIRSIWLHQQDEDEVLAILENSGMANFKAVYNLLDQFKKSSQLNAMTATGRQRLDTLMPTLLVFLREQSNPEEVLKRLLGLLQSILRRSVYLSLLNEYPEALKQLITLFAASPWIAQLLSRYPVLLDELLDPRNLYQIPTALKLKQELDGLLLRVVDDEEQQIESLRKFKQAQVLKIAAMDVAGVLDVFEVSEQLSNVAEILLDKVMSLALDWMVAKHGQPTCVIDGEEYLPSMAVVAYGKMGGRELSYSSDLDLVFLHDSQGEQQQTNGERVLDNTSFFARMAQRVIHLLSLQTANGRLYEIDMRLRPDGNAGMLVSSVQAYDLYQHEKAWTWEHQALIRASILCSSEHLALEFGRIRRSILMRQRDNAALATDVVEMREKMRDALGTKHETGQFHLKQDAGGLVDIEFIAQYGVLSCASKYEQFTEYTATRKILMKLIECNLLNSDQAQCLYDAYREYRTCNHQRALQQLTSVVEIESVATLKDNVKEIWRVVFEKQSVV